MTRADMRPMKNAAIMFAIALALAFSILPASAINNLSDYNGTFFEGFESNSLATNGWAASAGTGLWATSNVAPYAGTYHAQAGNTASGVRTLNLSLSTIGYTNINVAFYYSTANTEAGDNILAQWYNGTTWLVLVNTTSAASYTLSSTSLPSSADNNTGFYLRYSCLTASTNERCRIDNVSVTGIRIGADIISPNVTLVSPAANYYNDSGSTINITFQCNATDNVQLKNISLYITNPLNSSFALNQTTNTSGTSNSASWILALGKGNYTWNCRAFDNSSNSAFAASNRSIVLNSTNKIPTQGIPILNSTYGTNYTNENLTCHSTSTFDADGDSVKDIYNWYMNGTSITGLNMPFEGGSNSTYTRDYSGNSNNAFVSGVAWNSSGGYDGRGAYMFDRGGVMRIADSASTRMNNSMTILMRIKPKLTTLTLQYLIEKGLNDNDNYALFMETNQLSFEANTTAGYSSVSTTAWNFAANTWYHIGVVINGTSLKFYKNGVNIENATLAGNIAVKNYNLYIGFQNKTTGNYQFNGTIDEVMVLSRILTPQEIALTYSNRSYILAEEETEIGDRWRCEVTPNDGYADGSTNSSTNLTIVTPVSDTTRPSVSAIQPTTANEDTAINYNATVSDNIAVTSCILYINNTNNGSMTVAGNLANRSVTIFTPGIYSFKANCSDAAGNYNDTSITIVTINDITKPSVFDLRPVQASTYNVSQTIDISANATDNVAVSSARANITYPNSTIQLLTLANITSQKYNSSFTIPLSITGQYNVTFIVNDTSNNVNSTSTTFFVSQDNVIPSVSAIQPTTANEDTAINYNATVSDNIAVTSCILYINNTNNGSMTVAGNLANRSVTIFTPGIYSFKANCSDAAGNYNDTSITTVTILDITKPSVFDAKPAAGSNYNISSIITISANVTDNTAVSHARANITFPNSTVQELVLSRTGATDRYNSTFTIPSLTGQYDILFIANDTSNNVNSTTTTFFVSTESTAPAWSNPASNSTTFYWNESMKFNTTWTDNYALAGYIFSIKQNGSSWVNTSYTPFGGTINLSQNISLITASAGSTVQWYFWANDTAGNHNQTDMQSFIVQSIPTTATLSTDQSLYPQGYASSAFKQFNVTFNSRYYSSSDSSPISGATCTVYNSETTDAVSLSYDAGTGNYTGMLSTRMLYSNVSFSVNCSKTDYAASSANTSALVWWMMHLTETSNTIMDGGFNSTHIMKRIEPLSSTPYVLSFARDLVQGENLIEEFTYCGSGINCTLGRDYYATGIFGLRMNMSVNDSACKPKLCYYFREGDFNKIYEDCAPYQSINADTATLIESNITDEHTLRQGYFIGLSVYLNCTAPVTETVDFYYNYSGQQPNLFITSPKPTEVNSFINSSGQSDSSYYIGPNQKLDELRWADIALNNTAPEAKYLMYIFIPRIYSEFTNSVVQETTHIYNSTGQLWASDNISASAPYNATIFSNNQIEWQTEMLPAQSIVVERTYSVLKDCLRNNETMIDDTAGTKVWNITLSQILTTVVTSSNITVWTNYSAHGTTAAWDFNVSKQTNGVTTDITGEMIINSTAGIMVFPKMNMNSPVIYTMTARDGAAPAVFDAKPAAGSNYNVSQTIEISANATDNVAVDTALANVSYPNSTVQLLTLSPAGGSKYSSSFNIPNVTGQYDITFIVNDTRNNINRTTTTFFVSQDNIFPSVTNLLPSAGSTYNQSSIIPISADVTDNLAISSVKANVTIPGSSPSLITMANAGGDAYGGNLTTTSQLGQYNITLIATDSSGNINNTVKTYIIIEDAGFPIITAVLPADQTEINRLSSITISANVTDSNGISAVRFNITYPDSATQLITPVQSGQTYSYLFTNTSLIGEYAIKITANDTSNNAASAYTSFISNDVTLPSITGDCYPKRNKVNYTFICNATVTDDVAVSNASAQVKLPDHSTQPSSLTNLGNVYSFTFSDADQYGIYNVTWTANDTSNNIQTFITNFGVTQPIIIPLGCDPDPVNISAQTICQANITSGMISEPVDKGLANVTLPTGTAQVQTVTNISDIHSFTFTNTAARGTYSILWVANDTSNVQSAYTDSFTARGTAAPAIQLNYPANGANFTNNNNIIFNWTATDIYEANVSCSLTVDSTTIASSIFSQNATAATYPVSGLSETTHYWNVTCSNSDSNTETSSTRHLLIDATAPTISSVSNSTITNQTAAITWTTDESSNSTVIYGTTLALSDGTAANATYSTGHHVLVSGLLPATSYYYNVTSCDAYGNCRTSGVYNFTTLVNIDIATPAVFDLRPVQASTYNVSDIISISANVTDNINVSVVKANITYPNSTVNLIGLSRTGATDRYNSTFTIPLLVGQYNITFIANDTSNNLNRTTTTFFVSQDNVIPSVSAIQPTTANEDTAVNYNATVSDNIAVTSCILYINNTNNGSMTVAGNLANRSVTIFTPGIYSFKANCSDAAGNYNDTSITNIAVSDLTKPAIAFTGQTDQSGTIKSSTGIMINISASDANLNYSIIRIYNASGSLINSTTLTFINFTVSNDGMYYFNASAYDLSGNHNHTETRNVTIDATNPSIAFISPTPPDNAAWNYDYLTINASVLNGNPIGSCILQWNGTNESMTKVGTGSNVTCYAEKTGLSYVNYSYKVYANDSINNINVSETRNVRINSPPYVRIIHPLDEIYDTNSYISIVVNATDTDGVNSTKAEITYPNSTKINTSLYVSPQRDTFNSNTLGIVWSVEDSLLGPSQACVADIDATVAGKAFTSISGDGSPGIDSRCSLVLNYPVTGDFDMNVTFEVLSSHGADSALNFYLTEVPSSVNATRMIFMSLGNWTGYGKTYDIFADDGNFSGYISSRETSDTSGKFRIKRQGNDFTFYTWNSSSSWSLETVSQNEFNMEHGLFIILESESSTQGWNPLSVSWDNLETGTANYSVGLFSDTASVGDYGIRIYSTDRLGAVNSTETTNFTTIEMNDMPSAPFIFQPVETEIISGIYTIIWQQAVDEESDNLQFNITLLNPDLTFNATVVGDYGNSDSTSYNMDTHLYRDGEYSLKVTLFENETAEAYSNSYTIENVTIDNTPPSLELISPTEISGSVIGRDYIQVNVSAYDIHFDTLVVSLYNLTSLIIYDYTPNSSQFFNFTGLAAGLYYFNASADDHIDNWNHTETRNVTIVADAQKPVVTDLRPLQASVYNLSRTIEIAANVTDDLGVDNVKAAITYPNSSTAQLTLSNAIGNKYNASFADIVQKGIYSIAFIANDTYNNINSTETTYFERIVFEENKTFDVIDENGDSVQYDQTLLANNSGLLDIQVNFTDYTIDNAIIRGFNESQPFNVVKISRNTSDSYRFNTTFAIDLSEADLINATITLNATGNTLYKCSNYTFSTQTCNEGYEYLMYLVPGQMYSFTINSTDPGFGDTSPDEGTPDAGSFNPFGEGFSEISNTYTATQANDGVTFGVRQVNGGAANADLEAYLNLSYNLTPLANAGIAPNKITNMSFRMEHCYVADVVGAITCTNLGPGGTIESPLSIELLNASSGSYQAMGSYTDSSVNESNATLNLSGTRFSDFVNPTTNFIGIRYAVNVTITSNGNDAAFGSDYASLTVSYDNITPIISAVTNYSITNQSAVINWTTNELANGTVKYGTTPSLGNNATSASFALNRAVSLAGLQPSTLYYYNVTSCDQYTNCNTSGVYNFTTIATADITPPAYSNLTESPADPATYAPGQRYEFNSTWTDSTAVDKVKIEWAGTNYTVTNYTGNVYNFTIFSLAAAIYNYIWHANDTYDNRNSTGMQTYTVTRAQAYCALAFDKTTPINYSTLLNASCSCANNETSAILYRNSTDVTSAENNKLIELSAGSYLYNCTSAQTQNYTAASNSSVFNVNKRTTTTNLTLNGNENDLIIFYGTSVVVNATTDYGALTLYRNSTSLGSGQSVQQIIDHKAGVYNYTAINPGNQNLTDSSASWSLTVNKGTGAVNLTLNGTSANMSILQDEYVNITAALVSGSGYLELYRNSALINNGTSPLINITQFASGGLFEITAAYPANENYTFDSETYFITVNSTEPPVYENRSAAPASPATYSESAAYYFNITWSDLSGISSAWIEHNFTNSGSLQNYTITLFSGGAFSRRYYYQYSGLAVGAYSWAMYANDTSNNLNFTNAWLYEVQKATPTLTINRNPSASFVYGASSNMNCTANTAQTSVLLYRNGTSVSNPDTTLLGAGIYNYSCISSATQNYTASSAQSIVTVTKAGSAVSLTINGVNANTTALQNSNVEINSTMIAPASGNISIYSNTTLLASGIATTTIPVSVTTNFSSIGTYLITAAFAGDENHTSNSSAHYLTINDSLSPIVSLIGPATDNVTGSPATFYYNVSDDSAIANCSLIISNGINRTSASVTKDVQQSISTNLTSGAYSWSMNCTDSYGNTGNSSTRTVIIDNDGPSITLNAPAQGFKTNSTSINFSWTAVDSTSSSMSCSLKVDSATVASSLASPNNTLTSYASVFGANAAHYWNMSCADGLGNLNTSSTRNFTIDALAPTINAFVTNDSDGSNYAFGNGTIITFTANVTDLTLDRIWVVITLPDSTTQTVYLNNSQPAAFSLPASLIGRYNITLYANDSVGHISSTADYFLAAPLETIEVHVLDINSAGILNNLTMYLNGTGNQVHLHTFNGVLIEDHATVTYDLLFKVFGSNMSILFRNINLSIDSNDSVVVDRLPSPVTGYVLSYGINTSYNFATADVKISYAGLSYSDENDLVLDKCDDWNMGARICVGNFAPVAATQNMTGDYFETTVTSFSGFSIRDSALNVTPITSTPSSLGSEVTYPSNKTHSTYFTDLSEPKEFPLRSGDIVQVEYKGKIYNFSSEQIRETYETIYSYSGKEWLRLDYGTNVYVDLDEDGSNDAAFKLSYVNLNAGYTIVKGVAKRIPSNITREDQKNETLAEEGETSEKEPTPEMPSETTCPYSLFIAPTSIKEIWKCLWPFIIAIGVFLVFIMLVFGRNPPSSSSLKSERDIHPAHPANRAARQSFNHRQNTINEMMDAYKIAARRRSQKRESVYEAMLRKRKLLQMLKEKERLLEKREKIVSKVLREKMDLERKSLSVRKDLINYRGNKQESMTVKELAKPSKPSSLHRMMPRQPLRIFSEFRRNAHAADERALSKDRPEVKPKVSVKINIKDIRKKELLKMLKNIYN